MTDEQNHKAFRTDSLNMMERFRKSILLRDASRLGLPVANDNPPQSRPIDWCNGTVRIPHLGKVS